MRQERVTQDTISVKNFTAAPTSRSRFLAGKPEVAE
jgi:hypothetical protein